MRRLAMWLDDAQRDVTYAARTLRRTPGFTAVAVLTIALGVGANTAIFSVVHAVLLKPLSFEQSERLVHLYENVPAALAPDGKARRISAMPVQSFLELRARPPRSLSHLTSFGYAYVTIAGGGDGLRLPLSPVSAAAFPMLGVQPILGRVLTSEDEQRGNDKVVVLSYDAWQRYFAGDREVLGRGVRFNGSRFSGNIALGAVYTVVGVMPRGFHFPNDYVLFWTPLIVEPPAEGRLRRTPLIARLADGGSIEAAVAEMNSMLRDPRVDAQTRPGSPPRFELVRLQDEVGAPVKPALLVLVSAVACVLLIACANVANLLLARSAGRQREISVRIALGAGRGRLIRQLLTESVLLACIGGLGGTAIASSGLSLFRLLATNLSRVDLGSTADFPRLDAIGLNMSVVAFAAAASLATGVLFGLAPAIRHSRAAPANARSVAALRYLVIAEIAMATLLCVSGGLLIRSFANLTAVDLGYDPTRVMTFQVSLPGERRPIAQDKSFAEEIVARLRSAPGVEAAAYANQLPMVSLRDTAGGFRRSRDSSAAPSPDGPDARFVSRDYFAVMGIRVIAGRGLREDDDVGRPRVMVINQELARRDFPGENPIGQMAYVGRDPVPWQIVGIVGNVRQFGLDRQPEPQFFADVRQWPETGPIFPVGAYYAVRTSGDPVPALGQIRTVVLQLNAQASLDNIATMEAIVANSMTRPRMYTVLLSIFAAVAGLVAVAGIYGVMAYSVAQRTREIGIRMALGARRTEVLRLVMRESTAQAVSGLILGLAVATVTTRYLESLLFGLTPLDPLTFAVAAVVFGFTATTAAFLPARQATRVEPAIALRCE